jgi:transposase InsO family protein
LKTKSAEEILLKIDNYIQSFGEPKIFQSDNGSEFSNRLLKNYCTENNIKLVFSSPYHPKSNGACESVHKEIGKYLLNKFIKNEDNFELEKELLNIIKIYNNKVHSTTSRIPKEIKDLQDPIEVENIKAILYDNLFLKNKDKEYLDIKDFFCY